MKRETQNDLRFIKTEALIQNTFRAMIREKDFSEMTIQELVTRAQINRKTFYLHYQSLNDLLISMQFALLDKLFQTYPEKWVPENLEELIQKLFLFLAKADETDAKIIAIESHLFSRKNPKDYLRKRMYHYLESYDNFSKYNNEEKNIFVSYLYGSFVMMYNQWQIDGRKIPLETMTDLTVKLISQGIYSNELLKHH